MHKYPENQSYVGSSGQTLTTNVSVTGTGTFVTKPISYVATLHLYRIKLGTKSIWSLRPLWLGQGCSYDKGGRGITGLTGCETGRGTTCLPKSML